MARLLVLYSQPSHPAAFDHYYFKKHAPLARTIPGLRSYTVNAAPIGVIASGQKPYLAAGLEFDGQGRLARRAAPVEGSAPYLVAVLEFDSMDALQSAMASPEGQATAADLANFAQAGVTILAFEAKTL